MSDLDELLALLEAAQEDMKYNKIKYFTPDGWHLEMFEKGVTQKVRGVCASNRIGKSYSATFELCVHLTGLYPDWWKGHRFPTAIDAMALGSSWSQIMGQKAIHELIFGPLYDVGSGWLPKDAIIDTRGAGQLGAIGVAQIKHVSGGTSTLKMATYGQGDENLMGSALSFFVVDEDPNDAAIITQLVKRGWSIPNSRGLCVMTPESGLTPSVNMFWDKKGIYHSGLVHKTLFDSTLYTDKQKQDMLESIEPWARRFSIYGEPSAGTGAVFAGIMKDNIILPCPDIGENWLRLGSIDFGYRDDTAVLFVAYDPSTSIYYVYDEYVVNQVDIPEISPHIVSRQQKYIPLVYPPDGNAERGLGTTFCKLYEDNGVLLTNGIAANWLQDPSGKDRSISTGIMYIRSLMKDGKLFISPTCVGLLKEIDLYAYNDQGKFIDKNNHCIDSLRYNIMSLQKFGVSKNESTKTVQGYVPEESWI